MCPEPVSKPIGGAGGGSSRCTGPIIVQRPGRDKSVAPMARRVKCYLWQKDYGWPAASGMVPARKHRR